jgi:hypothetical protein
MQIQLFIPIMDIQTHQEKLISEPIVRIRKTTSIITNALNKKEQQRLVAYGPVVKEATSHDIGREPITVDELPYQQTTEASFDKTSLILAGIIVEECA